ncbi:primosomal protein DnaI [Bacillus suaedaesalsae]|uniref:Primosomal protein DnaI n=1 Tax=Bacillus suaedaesalsae TaxID=2810349 RepID=A0ABS2DGC8_9BACI|nr:primosomal protein DnaI [Bacillus suaedaesalsae]MBM6617508.1 primosomal protein DnaI [Bacillus suaedaesalsae]
MKSIKDALNQMSYPKRMEEQYEKFKDIVLNDPDIKVFLDQNRPFLNRKIFDSGLLKMYEYHTQSKECANCPSLSECVNMVPGYHPQLVLKNKQSIELDYQQCPSKVLAEIQKEKKNKIKSVYIPSNLLNATFMDIYEDDEYRYQIKQQIWSFLKSYKSNKNTKGFYIHGGFGVGKTYILCAIANELAEENTESMIMYFPEFIRELKSVMSNEGAFNNKLEAAKKVPVLMFDDIGAESMTSWMRDEILGPILQYRMLEKLPTFFTSNLNLDELLRHYTYSQKGEEEGIKAKRILERVKFLTEEIELVDINRRN